MNISKFLKDQYQISVGELVAINGRLAKGYATVTEISWDVPLADVDESPAGEDNGRPFPPHVRVKMLGSTMLGDKAGKENRKFLFHGEDFANDKILKLSDIDFV